MPEPNQNRCVTMHTSGGPSLGWDWSVHEDRRRDRENERDEESRDVALNGRGGKPPLPGGGANYFPNVPVIDQNGRTLNFYDDVIKGKIVVISFIYTSCQDLCPLTTARMAQLADKLGDDKTASRTNFLNNGALDV